jgi:hypothetical protein
MHTNSINDDRSTNTSAATLTVAAAMLTGFSVAAAGITIASVAWAVTGFILLLGRIGLYALLLV